MKKLRFIIAYLFFCLIVSCASKQSKVNMTADSISVNEFSSSVELLITDIKFLEEEVLKINAKNPSVQRIIVNSDTYLKCW